MSFGRGLGRGRGRGKIIKEEEKLGLGTREPLVVTPTPSTSTSAGLGAQSYFGLGRGRGRGRGIYPADWFQTDNPSDSEESSTGQSSSAESQPLRDREDPLSDSSDEDDDFIAQFRRTHVSFPVPEGRGESAGMGTPFTADIPEPFGAAGFKLPVRGRGRGISVKPSTSSDREKIMRGILESPILQKYPSSQSQLSSSSSSDTSLSRKVVVQMKGDKGVQVPLSVNYIRLKRMDEKGLFEYHVDFIPDLESRRVKKGILYGPQLDLGNIINFDGSKLYLPYKLKESVTVADAPHPNFGSVTVQIKFVKESSFDEDCLFYNILLRRVMNRLGFLEMQRNFFDHERVFDIPEHKLEIWPGFVTAIDCYEGGLMLCCDSTFRVLRKDTLLDALYRFLQLAEQDRRFDFKTEFRNYALGKVVLTNYNNKHYRVDDVDWDSCPKSTFPKTVNGKIQEVCFADYYRSQYNVHIQDLQQPLIVSRAKPRKQWMARDTSPPENILLVPELCHVTGMTEEITSDYRIMRTLADKTRIPPVKRMMALEAFINAVKSEPEARKVFEDWGLQLEDGVVQLNGRVIASPRLIVGKEKTIVPRQGEFGKDLLRSHILDPIAVSNWLLIFHQSDESHATKIVQNYSSVAEGLGIPYRQGPQIIRIQDRKASEYRRVLVQNIREKTQFVVIIIPSNRDDVYRVIKTVCNRECPVPSQVIRNITLSNEKKTRSILQKVAMQINCKLGGALWTIKIPLPERIMFMGMDVYHDPRKKNASVTAIVCSVNLCYTKYYTRVIFQSPQQETVSSLHQVVLEALQTFYEENKAFPDRIIMFRDGVGDGQLSVTKQHEVAQILKAFYDVQIEPMFTFVVVQKRINTRIFLKDNGSFENPEPGTVLDHTITRRYLFDFFLVSQLIREGTVNPTHYIVLHDNSDIKPDVIQKFAYACSFMYFNWSGTIRVPAMCQYAHKAAGLVGQHMGVEPSKELADKLYYL